MDFYLVLFCLFVCFFPSVKILNVGNILILDQNQVPEVWKSVFLFSEGKSSDATIIQKIKCMPLNQQMCGLWMN